LRCTQLRRVRFVGDPYSVSQILWSTDPGTQRAIGIVLGLALMALSAVYIPLLVRLVRLYLLERRLLGLVEYALGASPGGSANHTIESEELRGAFANSPISAAYDEFERRWATARLGETIERAPIRLMDIFDERPLLPFGPRRSLLPILPGLLLATGVFAAVTGLIPTLAAATAVDELSGDARTTWMLTQVGLALRTSAWGFLCAIGASLMGRLIEGSFDARSHSLDGIIEWTFGSVSPGELAEITRRTQQQSIDTLGHELSKFANELNERLDRGLKRIEQSTARSANLVSQEQRGALHTVVQELSLSVRQGVEHHLSELRNALQRAVEHQSSVTGGLAETFERMVENSKTQDRVARTLAETATSVEQAALAMRGSATEMQPILEHLSSTSQGLSDTAARIADTQTVVARTAEGVRGALEHAASGVDDQRQFIEVSLGEIRHALHGLGDGLGESLQRSLRSVDDVLGSTIGQLRDTLIESNETIERLTLPIRAAEGSTRETHLALDRVKAEVEALGQWLSQTIKPLRSGLSDVEGRAEEIARTMTEFSEHTRQIDRTMESLREEIHEESRRLQGTGSELSRRIKLATDAVGLIEPAAPAASRPSTPTSTSNEDPASTASERRGSPAPDSVTPSRAQTIGHESNGDSIDPAATASQKGRDDREPGDAGANAGSDLARTGYRVGTPRAQGPDPYSRFDNQEESPSNVRHFPTPDRDLGDNLKLSGLLGPSGRGANTEKESSTPSEDGEKTVAEDSNRPAHSPRSSDEPESP
jgi:methyl-accepting chemotaxis protein